MRSRPKAAERAVCPVEELDETASGPEVPQVRGLAEAWRTKVREPLGAHEDGVPQARAASSRLVRGNKKWPPEGGQFFIPNCRELRQLPDAWT